MTLTGLAKTWEEDWLQPDRPAQMLERLLAVRKAIEPPRFCLDHWPAYAISDRKLRLIGCGMCRWVWHLLPDLHSKSRVRDAERLADGEGTGRAGRGSMTDDALKHIIGHATDEFSRQQAARWCKHADVLQIPRQVHAWLHRSLSPTAQAQVIRDVVGNPFRPVSFSPAWRTPDVMRLAQHAYEHRDEDGHLHPDVLAKLSDALEEAGCTQQTLLDHLREECASGTGGIDYHVRGCWALDLVLGKS